MISLKDRTVNLTGHRPKSLPWGYDENKKSCKNYKEKIKKVLEALIKSGFTYFLTGMAEGFDMIGTEILLELRNNYEIKVIAIIPCSGQELKWNIIQQKRYHQILSKCDDKIVLNKVYTSKCMNERNKYMVDNSSICVACWNGQPSGTGNTVRFAKQNGNKVIVVNPENFDIE